MARGIPDPVAQAREALLEGVGREVASSFPGITRLGGQIVAALYLADGPRSMDQLADELGRAKSNVFANVRALEAAKIVDRRREAGARYDTVSLRGPYPDVVIGAYVSRLRDVTDDKRELVKRAQLLLGDATGPEADGLRARMGELGRKYELFGKVFDLVMPGFDGPIDLEALLSKIPPTVISTLTRLAQAAIAASRRGRG